MNEPIATVTATITSTAAASTAGLLTTTNITTSNSMLTTANNDSSIELLEPCSNWSSATESMGESNFMYVRVDSNSSSSPNDADQLWTRSKTLPNVYVCRPIVCYSKSPPGRRRVTTVPALAGLCNLANNCNSRASRSTGGHKTTTPSSISAGCGATTATTSLGLCNIAHSTTPCNGQCNISLLDFRRVGRSTGDVTRCRTIGGHGVDIVRHHRTGIFGKTEASHPEPIGRPLCDVTKYLITSSSADKCRDKLQSDSSKAQRTDRRSTAGKTLTNVTEYCGCGPSEDQVLCGDVCFLGANVAVSVVDKAAQSRCLAQTADECYAVSARKTQQRITPDNTQLHDCQSQSAGLSDCTPLAVSHAAKMTPVTTLATPNGHINSGWRPSSQSPDHASSGHLHGNGSCGIAVKCKEKSTGCWQLPGESKGRKPRQRCARLKKTDSLWEKQC